MAPIVVYSFRAGRLSLENKMLKADTRKGAVQVAVEDEMVHVRWCVRADDGSLSLPEDDFVVFPGECSLQQINKTRNYVLKFPQERDRDMFFWMQDPPTYRDDDTTTGIFNDLVNKEGAAAAKAVAVAKAAARPPISWGDALKDADPQGEGTDAATGAAAAPAAEAAAANLAAPRGTGTSAAPGAAPGAAAAATGAGAPQGSLAASLSAALAASASRQPQPADASQQLAQSLAAALAAQQAQGGGGGAGSGESSAAMRAALARAFGGGGGGGDDGPSIGEVLRPELLAPLLETPDALAALAEHLPEEHRSPHELRATLSSHALRQQLGSLGAAIQSGQLSLEAFGLRGARGTSVADFLAAIQESVDAEAKDDGAASGDPMQS